MVHDFIGEADGGADDALAPNIEHHGWSAPFLTTFRLEQVDEPGAWSVRGLRVRRRLYTITLSFG